MRDIDGSVLFSATDLMRFMTETAPNLPITKRIEIVTAEVAFGMNIFKDLFAGIRDIVGGRSEAVQVTMIEIHAVLPFMSSRRKLTLLVLMQW